MSYVVEEWVWHECQIEEARLRYLLLAIARHCASDEGTGAHASEARLAAMVRADKKTVRADVRRLEAAGELLVWRPAVRAKGRTNRYVVVMGRDPVDVQRLVEERHRPQPAMPATEREPTGPLPVHYRSTTGPSPRSAVDRIFEPRTQKRASAARSSPARARPLDSRLDPLRAELDGIAVSWVMTDEQAEAVAALLEVHGARSLAAVALDLVTARGRPTFARAWLGTWRQLPVPGGTVRSSDVPEPRVASDWCGSCDAASFRFEVDDGGVPLRPCPRCHPTSREPAPF